MVKVFDSKSQKSQVQTLFWENMKTFNQSNKHYITQSLEKINIRFSSKLILNEQFKYLKTKHSFHLADPSLWPLVVFTLIALTSVTFSFFATYDFLVPLAIHFNGLAALFFSSAVKKLSFNVWSLYFFTKNKIFLLIIYFDQLIDRWVTNSFLRIVTKIFISLFGARLVILLFGTFLMEMSFFLYDSEFSSGLDVEQRTKMTTHMLASSPVKDGPPALNRSNLNSASDLGNFGNWVLDIPENVLNDNVGDNSSSSSSSSGDASSHSVSENPLASEEASVTSVSTPVANTQDWGTSERAPQEVLDRLLEQLEERVAAAGIEESSTLSNGGSVGSGTAVSVDSINSIQNGAASESVLSESIVTVEMSQSNNARLAEEFVEELSKCVLRCKSCHDKSGK